jgi:nucleotide-binding universal stress UspA family protein
MTKKLLVPVDGSECSLRAVRHLLDKGSGATMPGALAIHLVNVQPGLPGDVTRFVSRDQIAGYHHDESKKALVEAKALLDAAGVPYEVHAEVGPLAETIVKLAERLGCDEIVMGAHGRTALAEFLIGSTVTRVVHLARVPVLLVK